MKRILILVACLCGLQVLQAQTTGQIAGTVRDPSGGIVAGALVTCSSGSTGERRMLGSDSAGHYSIPLLLPGIYHVSVSAQGFATQTFDNVIVAITETTVLDTELALGAAASEVTVEGAPLVQAAGAQLGRVVDSRAISGLPLATRNFTQILGLSPGTATYLPDNDALGRNTQTISVNGARVTQNSVQLNGVDATTMAIFTA